MFFLSGFIFCLINGVNNVPLEVTSASAVDSSATVITDNSTGNVFATSTATMGLIQTTKYSNTLETDSSNVSLLDLGSSSIYAILNVNYCSKWKQTNHIYFQIANAFFLLSLLAPRGVCGLLFLRIAILLTSCFTCLWAWTVECYFDAMLWNLVFIIVNLIYIMGLLYHLRPIKFDKEIEEVYGALFAPLRVSRRQFLRVLSCMRVVRHLKPHELHAQEKVTKVDSLSLVLSGKLVVSQNQRALHIVFPHHFLDSPEWFGVSTDEYFQVSIMAMEESRILVWHRDKLKLSIMTDAFLQSVFDHILGRDVVHKLMQVSETMGASNGHLPNSHEEGEDKPMLLLKKAGDGPGITALLTRQLQDEHVPLLTTRLTSMATNCSTPPAVRTHSC